MLKMDRPPISRQTTIKQTNSASPASHSSSRFSRRIIVLLPRAGSATESPHLVEQRLSELLLAGLPDRRHALGPCLGFLGGLLVELDALLREFDLGLVGRFASASLVARNGFGSGIAY